MKKCFCFKNMLNSGAYQINFLVKADKTIQIGKFGVFWFERGEYVYTGSAMKNLRQRVARHWRREKALKWHIDYILTDIDCEVKSIELYFSEIKQECKLNQSLLKSGRYKVWVEGLGSSDCRDCQSHLLKLK